MLIVSGQFTLYGYKRFLIDGILNISTLVQSVQIGYIVYVNYFSVVYFFGYVLKSQDKYA